MNEPKNPTVASSPAGTGSQGLPHATAPQGAPAMPNSGDQKPKKGRGVSITERAAKEVLRVIEEHKLPAQTWVRIGAKGGGCSGFSYVLDFDQTGPTEFDIQYEMHGVHLVIDKKSEFFMGGTVLDFNDGLLNRGFTFQNPAASGTCGCGTSFSA